MKWPEIDPPVGKAPIAAGLVIVAAGVLLSKAQPHLFDFPDIDGDVDPKARYDKGDKVGAVAQEGRDRLMAVLPENLFGWVGRGLMVLGTLVVITRLLDWLVDDDGMTK